MKTQGYAAAKPGQPLAPWSFERRSPGPHDVVIDATYCGVCHSDIHQVRDEWAEGIFPMVPGHEVVGIVREVGSEVTRFKPGDRAGVGCMVDSCGTCDACRAGLEQYCTGHVAFTYNGTEMDEKTPTYGGYSRAIVVRDSFVLRLPETLDMAAAAPLLCAGITTWSPLRHWKVGPGMRVAVVGLGGLGHMGVQFASRLGADVTVFTRSDAKAEDARRLGAHHVNDTSAPFDLVLSTISSQFALQQYVELLRRDGTMVLVGLPPHSQQPTLDIMPLVSMRRSVSGSMIGGIAETQEMLDFCGQHGITSQIELIPIQQVNEAYDRVLRGDVRYRFVIDLASL
ncbi:MAG: NAD(P)-dependent alcohol dehydrogenase [Candidatus Xenobia bacterium]